LSPGKTVFALLDWFIPPACLHERSELGVARNFVFTHLVGPALAQSMSVYLLVAVPASDASKWTLIAAISLFWALPFVLRWTRNLQLSAFISFELLAVSSLFGTYHFGGVSSPFLPWLVVSLLLGFFYLSERPLLVIGTFFADLAIFAAALVFWGPDNHIEQAQLAPLGLVSILSATTYVAWMATFYASIVVARSDTEKEAERHRATAAQLQRAKELAEKASLSKSIFLAKMSHELRTPLNAVIGYSEMLLEDAEAERKNEQMIADLGRIRSAGKHLLSLVDDVLDLSRIESAEMKIEVEEFEVQTLVDEVVANARPLMATHGNTLEIKVSPRIGSMRSDPTKIRQIVLNLLSNAAKFTDHGTIQFSAVRDHKVGGDWIEFAVADTGIGIAAADLARLFRNYEQVSASTARNHGGTGLGLALSQRLSALIGGAIRVDSEVARGSTFTLRIPSDVNSEQAAGDDQDPPGHQDLAA